MAVQNYKNHVRYYAPHHFVFYPLILCLLLSAGYYAFTDLHNQKMWIFISILIFVLGWLAFMMRQHYGLTLQNRIVRLELRYRYFAITGKRFELIENELTDNQLFALRFASDDELPHLVNRTINEKMSGNAIKKAIINWFPDYNRI